MGCNCNRMFEDESDTISLNPSKDKKTPLVMTSESGKPKATIQMLEGANENVGKEVFISTL